jgi:amidase
MTGFPYPDYDATSLAELVQKKEVTAGEITEAAIARLERLNPKINAVIHKMYEKARLAAEEITGREPFAGVPILLKDIGQEIKDESITSGAKALRSYRSEEDASFVKRVRATGVIFLGITNVPEFALMGITEPQYYGPTRNPWNTDYTPGGSSGGSAAAVASGICRGQRRRGLDSHTGRLLRTVRVKTEPLPHTGGAPFWAALARGLG